MSLLFNLSLSFSSFYLPLFLLFILFFIYELNVLLFDDFTHTYIVFWSSPPIPFLPIPLYPSHYLPFPASCALFIFQNKLTPFSAWLYKHGFRAIYQCMDSFSGTKYLKKKDSSSLRSLQLHIHSQLVVGGSFMVFSQVQDGVLSDLILWLQLLQFVDTAMLSCWVNDALLTFTTPSSMIPELWLRIWCKCLIYIWEYQTLILCTYICCMSLY